MKTVYKVVIAEDDLVVAENLKQMLEQMGHGVVQITGSAEDTVAAVELLQPDVLLLDLELRGSDGLQAAQEIMEKCPLPIVVCTAYAASYLFERAAEAGVSAYLIKPFRLGELMAAIALSYGRFAHWSCEISRTTTEPASQAA